MSHDFRTLGEIAKSSFFVYYLFNKTPLTFYIPNGIIRLHKSRISGFLCIGTKRRGEQVENRELIMQCAKTLFYSKGYDAVGVQEIVDRAGITKPTLYYYFGSKLGLLKTLIEVEFKEFRKLLHEAADMDNRIEEVLYRLARNYCSFFENDREFYMLFMALFYSARENEAYLAVKPYVTEFYELVVRIFDRAAEQLGNMNGRQRQFAIGFIGTINHYLILKFEEGSEKGLATEEINAVVRQFMYGIFS